MKTTLMRTRELLCHNHVKFGIVIITLLCSFYLFPSRIWKKVPTADIYINGIFSPNSALYQNDNLYFICTDQDKRSSLMHCLSYELIILPQKNEVRLIAGQFGPPDFLCVNRFALYLDFVPISAYFDWVSDRENLSIQPENHFIQFDLDRKFKYQISW